MICVGFGDRMPVRDRATRDRFMRQASFAGGFPLGGAMVHHSTAGRRTSVQDAAALRHRRRSTLRRQTARDLITEEEELVLPGEPKPTHAAEPKRRSTIHQQMASTAIFNPVPDTKCHVSVVSTDLTTRSRNCSCSAATSSSVCCSLQLSLYFGLAAGQG